MKVPLSARAFITDGAQMLEFWSNGERAALRSPVLPYVYSKVPLQNSSNELLDGYNLLYDSEYSGALYRCNFKNTKVKYESDLSDSFEKRVRLLDRVYTDRPEFVEQFANTNDLKIMSLDIETDSYMTFPNANENAIIAVGIQFNNNPIEIYCAEKYNDDEALLRTLIQRIKEEDPDIIVTYNGARFDFPYIIDRMAKHMLSSYLLTRDGTDVTFRKNNEGVIENVNIGGRIHYDILLRSVKNGQRIMDQNLFKRAPKRHDMKTIAQLYKCPDVIKEPKEIMSNMRSIVNTPRLVEYLTSDIRCTTYLRKIYLPALINLAEYLMVPLGTIIDATPSYTGTLIFARKFGALKIIGDKTVEEANPELANNKQGALVKTYRFGRFGKTRDVDFTSFYPNLIVQWNLCPTTTRIIEIRDTLEPFSTRLTAENYLIMSVPDEAANKQIIIFIDMNKKGIAAQFVQDLMADRALLKKQMKLVSRDTEQWTNLDVNQLNLKVIINALTGMFGLTSALFGSLASYIAITGSGRYILQSVKDFIGDEVISINTDGLYMTDFRPLEDINAWLEGFIKSISFTERSYIWLEDSYYESSYFKPNTEKHYILLEKQKDDSLELIIHGGGLKGSAKIGLFSNALEDLAYKMLTDYVGKDDVDAYFDRSTWTLENLTFGRNCKSKETYKNENDLGMQLIRQYEARFNTELSGTTNLSYVKVVPRQGAGDYKLVTIFDSIKDVPNIDYVYYEDEIVKVLEALSLEHLDPSVRKQSRLSSEPIMQKTKHKKKFNEPPNLKKPSIFDF